MNRFIIYDHIVSKIDDMSDSISIIPITDSKNMNMNIITITFGDKNTDHSVLIRLADHNLTFEEIFTKSQVTLPISLSKTQTYQKTIIPYLNE